MQLYSLEEMSQLEAGRELADVRIPYRHFLAIVIGITD